MLMCEKLDRSGTSRQQAVASAEQRADTEMSRNAEASDTSIQQLDTTEGASAAIKGDQQMVVVVASGDFLNVSSQAQDTVEHSHLESNEISENVAVADLSADHNEMALETSTSDSPGQTGAIIREYERLIALSRAQAAIHHSLTPIFIQFALLPLELKRRVWKFAAEEGDPNVIGVVYRNITHPTNPNIEVIQLLPAGPRNALHAVCQESRAALNLVQTPYLTQLDITSLDANYGQLVKDMFDLSVSGGGIVYRNDLKDTIFMNPADWNHLRVGRQWRAFGQLRGNTLAIPYTFWKLLADRSKGKHFMDELLSQGTKTVILVVGEPSMSTTPDSVLITPRRSPRVALSQDFWRNAHQCDAHLPDDFVNELRQHANGARLWDRIEAETWRRVVEIRQEKYDALIAKGDTPEVAAAKLHVVTTVKFAELTTRTELAARNELNLLWN